MWHPHLLRLLLAFAATAACAAEPDPWNEARRRGAIHADCARNASRLLQGWIDLKQDPHTHLYSRNRRWDYHNEAADHYSSLVLVAFYVAPALIQPGGDLYLTLANSQKLCATPSGIPTLYDLKARKPGPKASLGHLSEWLRDGLIRIVELLGTYNIWYRELQRLTDAMLAEARRKGGYAKAFTGTEPPGNMLQTLARLYAMSGKDKYLTAAEQMADPYLLAPHKALADLRFGDHGCELVPGLAELFVLECRLKRPKATQYREPMRKLLDRIVATGANPDTGLFCRRHKGKPTQPPDTWGYVLFAHQNYDSGTGEERYTTAIEKPLRWLVEHRPSYAKLKNTLWPRSKSSDDWSDSHESFIVLWNRYPRVPGAFDWLDWATRQHIHRRHPTRKYGPYTGGHFDGSTGRSLCIHMMLCSQGLRALPYTEGLAIGALQRGHDLMVSVEAPSAWTGKLLFDGPRTVHKAATIDWARLNEMPQWFVAQPTTHYAVSINGAPPVAMTGAQLLAGLPIALTPNTPRRIRITSK